jgi:alpha-aminoadipate/glutamate carrier protein LysW
MSGAGVLALSCPECEADIEIDPSVRQHEILECRDCRSELEVVGVQPLTLALAPDIEEDWGE